MLLYQERARFTAGYGNLAFFGPAILIDDCRFVMCRFSGIVFLGDEFRINGLRQRIFRAK